MTFPFTTKMRLDIDDPGLYPGQVVTAVRNPDGKLGGWGWITTAGRTYGTVLTGGVQALAYEGPSGGGAAASMHTEVAPALAGQPYGGYVVLPAPPSGAAAFNWQLQLKFYNSTDALIGTVNSGVTPGAGTNSVSVGATPVGTAAARLQLNLRDGSGAIPSGLLTGYVRDVRMGQTNNFATLRSEPVYRNLLTSSTSIEVDRAPLDANTLTAIIPDATYDPSVSTLLRSGRALRLVAIDASGVDQVLFQGKVVPASVKYAPRRNDLKRAQITLTALDVNTDLANVARPDGVAAVPDLRTLLEGAGVPWRVNGDTGQAAPAATITHNDNAMLLDQVVITRDSTLGYAWVDRAGVLNVYDGATMPSTLAATFTEATYGDDLEPVFDLEQVINVVSIKLLRRNAATGETVEIPFGPYRNEASIRQWGPRSADFTVQGIPETAAAMTAYADAVFASNATPRVRVNEMTHRIASTADVTAARALLDLYALARVTNSATGLDETSRITSIRHRITPKNWLITYAFGQPGGVPAPQPTPSLSSQPTQTPPPTQQTGVEPSGTFTPGTSKAITVAFPVPFDVAPQVFANVRSSASDQFSAVTVSGLTTTGCVLNVTRLTGTASVNMSWLAVV